MSLSDLNLESRVRYCFTCREHHIVNVNDYKTIQSLNFFEKEHRGHRTQVIDYKELKIILATQQSSKKW
ncbi:MAG: hypothetical protein KJI71_00575 [Patescibacteria group bacterium]|nr:hypothetical protein [Patescibacteria group bacterium]